jgi:hypothetical protein
MWSSSSSAASQRSFTVFRESHPISTSQDALQTVQMQLAGHAVRVIERGQLIAVKESLTRPKDREVALELRAIEERERGKP